ncbi:hypothetical protein E8E15_003620 [Penicillium rubens]|nr:hypothetical protein E8E15_003620 [Penicillium rubens]
MLGLFRPPVARGPCVAGPAYRLFLRNREKQIPAPDNEQVELLTQLRLARTWRYNDRRAIIRDARMIRRRAVNIQVEYATNGQPPRARMLRGLRQWLELELLTWLRLVHTWRNNARRTIIREARMITRRAPPRARMLRALRRWLQALIHNMPFLRAKEEAAREIEAEI